MTWGALAGLAFAAGQLCLAVLVWRQAGAADRRVRKRLKNEFPLPWGR